ncbi:GATOR1 complex protein NPRL2 [Anabrus simplex]|uniref:GATOR1 complex protein NPRL2 n=1 Tax=Anabrus simplex TaxID=316456 RepID=UPI0034DD1F4C
MTMTEIKVKDDDRYYEGCGHEGPIRCIFLCEFHPTAGPKITCQVPTDYVSKEIFDAVSVYIIPKLQLQRSILTVNALGYKITGFPVRIDNPKYARNAYYFNLCFVCDAWARTVQYEPVVKKLSEYLMTMEQETGFLSSENQSSEKLRLPLMLNQILMDLNLHGKSTVIEGTTTMHLKVVKMAPDPPSVADHHVPIFTIDQNLFREQHWDLTTQQVLPYIDGFNHVAKIAAEADVENNLVKSCVQNLVYYGAVSLIPIFQYSNVYSATPHLRNLAANSKLQEDCLLYVSGSDSCLPSLQDVFLFYCSMTYGTTLRDLCLRFNPRSLQIDERRLVQFGLLHKLIRRIHKYPVFIESNGNSDPPSPILRCFNGASSYDEICCSFGLSAQELDELVECDPTVTVIWK